MSAASPAKSREQLLQTTVIVVDKTAERQNLRRPARIRRVVRVKDVGLDSLVGGDGEPCDLVLPCCERFDRTLPAHGGMSLSKESVGGEIVDRDRDDESASDVLAHRLSSGCKT